MADAAFLLDTNILVYLIGGTSPILQERVEAQRPGTVVTSTLCVAEAAVGLRGHREAEQVLDRLMLAIAPIPFDLNAARRFPEIPFRRGKLDRFIAAQVLSVGLTLVTNNVRDFVDVPDLRIENWTRP